MNRVLVAGLACAAALALGCGEITELPPSGGGGGGTGGSAGGGGMAGSAMPAGGSGGGGMAGSATMEPDAGMSQAGAGGSSGEFQYPSGCPVPNPIGVPGQVIAIQSFNFSTSEVVLKNISNTTQRIVGTRQGWQWCSFPSYWNIAPDGDVTLPPGKTYKFQLINNTQGVWPLPQEGSELAIYIQSGTFDEPDKMVSFVSWGEGLATAGREYVAVLASLWTLNQRVEIDFGDAGFIATGMTNDASGYVGVTRRCLVAPPNGE